MKEYRVIPFSSGKNKTASAYRGGERYWPEKRRGIHTTKLLLSSSARGKAKRDVGSQSRGRTPEGGGEEEVIEVAIARGRIGVQKRERERRKNDNENYAVGANVAKVVLPMALQVDRLFPPDKV